MLNCPAGWISEANHQFSKESGKIIIKRTFSQIRLATSLSRGGILEVIFQRSSLDDVKTFFEVSIRDSQIVRGADL